MHSHEIGLRAMTQTALTPAHAIGRLRKLAALSGLSNEIADALVDIATGAARVGAAVVTDGPAVTVDAASQLLGCGKTRVFALLKAGDLKPAPRAGRRRMVLRSSIEAYLAQTSGQ